MVDVVEHLQEYIETYDLSQREMSHLLGCSESHLSRILRRKKEPGYKLLKAYLQTPGLREKKIINNMYKLITNLWIKNEISEEIAKMLIAELKLED